MNPARSPTDGPQLTRDTPLGPAPRLSVVLVNYCQWVNTLRLVRQLHRSACVTRGAVEVLVVDNHSPTHPRTVTLRRRKHVALRRWRRNRGFARAANEGFRLSRGDWLLFLNPDTTVAAGFLDEVLALVERTPADAGIVGLGLRDVDGTVQASAGPFPRLSTTLLGLLRPRRLRKYGGPADWVTGCGLLARRACLQQLGGFDPTYFLYYEDVDLCRRAAADGWAVGHEATPALVHHHPLHGRPVAPHVRLFARHALLTYASRHWPRWQATLLAWLIGWEAWVRGVVARWRGERRAAWVFRESGQLAGELRRGDAEAALRRVRRVARRVEVRRASPTVRCDPQPQPPGPAAPLPGERDALRPAADAGPRR
jgi:N-acetylglucosaminyl-diphospho-decaprenol L-rhamnosyltransferase